MATAIELASVVQQETPVQELTRPCLFNFIVYTQEMRRIDYFQEVIQTVIEKLPCRIIFIQAQTQTSKDSIHTKVSTLSASKDEEGIQCDYIQINAEGSYVSRVPFVILPYIVPDIPIYLLWGQDPTFQNDILPHLEKYATRLIFDSECTDDLAQFSHRLLQKIQKLTCDVMDMNWARCQGWCQALGHAFDNPDRLDHLRHMKKIVLTYNLVPTSCFYHHQIQAIYLQAWLATQLHWKFRSVNSLDGITTYEYSLGRKIMTVELRHSTEETFAPGAILRCEIELEDDHHVDFERLPNHPIQIIARVSHRETCDLPYYLPLLTRNRGFTFVKELLYAPTSKHYLSMLHSIAKLRHLPMPTECPKKGGG